MEEREEIFWQLLDCYFDDFTSLSDDVYISEEKFSQFINEKYPKITHLNIGKNWSALYIEIENHASEAQMEYVGWMISYVFGNPGQTTIKENKDKLKNFYAEHNPGSKPT